MDTQSLIERLHSAVVEMRNDGTPSQVGLTQNECLTIAATLASQAAEIERLRGALKMAHEELFEAADKFNVIHHNHPGAAADKGIGRYQAEDKEYCAKYSDRAAEAARRARSSLNGEKP